MAREELLKKLEELEEREFLINMVDRWTARDRELLAEVKKEIAIVREALA